MKYEVTMTVEADDEGDTPDGIGGEVSQAVKEWGFEVTGVSARKLPESEP